MIRTRVQTGSYFRSGCVRPEESNCQTGGIEHPDRKPFPTKSFRRLLEVGAATPTPTRGVSASAAPGATRCTS
jgi:hypothetical protein